ncbi:WD repeat domain phosphoinositide-interacting protein 1 isoform X2 [Teleopsis dalmanni]|uniref:WD repeat domain phosphoinositide-interacting protein 1 isoform X2 n=1 Tax=Teleopsis dalmanni TaxID=139649 RepID=UPI0018CCDF15|nr:WD repeat domain phosphoinositide-interacting protein 1 isoform X2 [Teleopsis dalmanni]
MAGYLVNFNQDFTSISIVSHVGFRLYSISSSDKIDEIFSKDNENIRLVERLFNSSLVVLVTVQKPNCLKMLHFKKKQNICNCVYPSEILCVRMNRHRLVVCLAESIHIHDIRDMKILHSIDNIAPNELGLCTLSLHSHLAFPICTTTGELRIFNANKLRPGLTIRAHDTALSALNFSSSGTLLATASERGTVIRVFCVKNGQRIQEFRRGVKRCVRIASLVFSVNGDYLCASSNTETVHIFKIDGKAVEIAEQKGIIRVTKSNESDSKKGQKLAEEKTLPATSKTDNATAATANTTVNTNTNEPKTEEASSAHMAAEVCGWSGYLSKAVTSYFIPSQVSDVLAQDRAFATAVLAQPGLKHALGLARVQKELKLLIVCEDGFLYIFDFNIERGGQCKLQHVHDLRNVLEGVVELNINECIEKLPTSSIPTSPVGESTKCTIKQAQKDVPKTCASSVIIENPDPAPDNSYAGILKGDQTESTLTDSAKFRKLCDAIDTPNKLYDERQFPPVVIAAKD